MSVGFRIEGLDELERQFDNLIDTSKKKVMQKALNAGIAPIKKEAKANAPKSEAAYRRYMSSGQGEKTRNGKRRGKSRRAKRGTGRYVLQQPGLLKKSIRSKQMKLTQNPAVGIYVSDKAYYWYFIENGTSKMPAAPFLRPAADSKHEEGVEKFKEKLKVEIDKVMVG